MTASELVSNQIIPLKTSDTGSEALGIMNDYYVRHMPVVNDTQLLGILSEEDVLNHDTHEAIGSYKLDIPTTVYADKNDHLFEVLTLLAKYKLTVVPVVDENHDYYGLITLEDLIQHFAKSYSFSETGSIVVVSVDKKDYSLSEISRIIEQEDTTILGLFINADSHVDSRVRVTIKVNRQDIQQIKASLDRHGYFIEASYMENVYFDTLKERYDQLINYLNV